MPKTYDWASSEAPEYRKLYKTAAWQALRKVVIVRDAGACRMSG